MGNFAYKIKSGSVQVSLIQSYMRFSKRLFYIGS